MDCLSSEAVQGNASVPRERDIETRTEELKRFDGLVSRVNVSLATFHRILDVALA